MRIAPGTFVAAAFIGPGTVTMATLAGARTGYVLLWGIVFSTLATLVLQEMALRVGVVGRRGLGEALRERLGSGIAFRMLAVLVIAAIGLGNAAYQAGNLTGAALGIGLLPRADVSTPIFALFLGVGTGFLLWFGRGTWLRATLAIGVGLLSLLYLGAAALSPIDWSAWAWGLLPTAVPSGAELLLVGLIGTTVVPYNLFLHASLARDHYASPGDLSAARRDAALSIGLGGLITLAIASLSAAAFAISPVDPAVTLVASDLATPLAASLGAAAPWVVGVGYFAAGLSSAVTAPLAAAFAISGMLGWGNSPQDLRFRAVWVAVLLVGTILAALGAKPVPLILLAQTTNGLLLPIIAALLLWVANDRKLLGDFRNAWRANVGGVMVVAVAILLGARALYGVWYH